jgi:hypothetical protein
MMDQQHEIQMNIESISSLFEYLHSANKEQHENKIKETSETLECLLELLAMPIAASPDLLQHPSTISPSPLTNRDGHHSQDVRYEHEKSHHLNSRSHHSKSRSHHEKSASSHHSKSASSHHSKSASSHHSTSASHHTKSASHHSTSASHPSKSACASPKRRLDSLDSVHGSVRRRLI